MSTFALVTLVNDRAQLEACQASLRAQVEPLPAWHAVEPNAKGWNAAQGLNAGIDALDADWIVTVHQDVLFPADFWARFTAALAALPPEVALAGVVGCERGGAFRGHIVDPNGHCYWGPLPADVLTLDEVLLAVRKSSGLQFAAGVPGFHCYGADICLEAAARGLRTAVVDAPVVHLSTGRLGDDYLRASRWLLAKWGARYGNLLPTPTIVIQDEARVGLVRELIVRWRRRRDVRRRNRNACRDATCGARALAAARSGGAA